MNYRINRWDAFAVSICFLPLSFLLIGNNEWIYAPLYSIDSYMNQAYSYFYDSAKFKSYSYKSSRVPWISFLFYLQKVVGPNLLQPIVVVGGWICINLAYYLTIRKLFNIKTALLLLPWIVFFPDIIGTNSGGGTYHANATSIMFLLGMYFWIEDSLKKKTSIINTTVASMFFSSVIHVGIVHLNLFLLLPIIDFYKGKSPQWKKYGVLLAGFILTTTFWGGVNYYHGRDFYFWNQILKTTTDFIMQPDLQQVWWRPISIKLLMKNGYLCFHLALVIITIIKLFADKNFKITKQNILSYHYIFLCLLWIVYHLVGHTALNPPDFVYPLQIPAFILIASWIVEKFNHQIKTTKILLVIISLWAALVYAEKIHIHNLVIYENKIPVGFIFLLIGLMIFVLKKKTLFNLVLVCFIAVSYSLFSIDPRFINSDCKIREETNHVLTSMIDFVMKAEPNPDNVFIYGNDLYNIDVTGGCKSYWVKISAHKFMHMGWNIFGNPLDYRSQVPSKIKDLDKYHFKHLIQTNGIVVLFPFDDKNFLNEFLKKARELHVELHVQSEYRQTFHGKSFPIIILKL